MNNTSSLKEYYVKLQGLYNNAVNMLTAINQSLTTSASEITVTVADSDDAKTTVRIPSFLYLENKLEQLDSNFNALFNMPKSGEAWFSESSNMYKLNLVKSNNAPAIPMIDESLLFGQTKENHILKDLVNPKTYLKLNISNLTDNISSMFMKKIVFYNKDLFNVIKTKNIVTYEDMKASLYNLKKGTDYDEYDSTLKLPIKKDEFRSRFEIIEIPKLENDNPWYEDESDKVHSHLLYKIRVNTITYTDQDDPSIEYKLKQGDLLTLENDYVIYKIKNIAEHKANQYGTIESYDDYNNDKEYILTIEEHVGHMSLQTYEENNNMVLKIYNDNYNKYHYVEIPLEENPYICIFIGTIYNNVRSVLSNAKLVDLSEIQMKDANGNLIYEGNSSTPMTYIEYYNKFCNNIGDLILGISETAYPQLSNYSKGDLRDMQESAILKDLVSKTIDNEKILTVKKINSHLINDVTSENIINLHSQKGEINSQLNSLQGNIDQVYNQLLTTDFNQEVSVTQESLRSRLTGYYNERLELQKQQIAIIDNINVLKGDAKGLTTSKFRIRGTTECKELEEYLHGTYGKKCDLIGLEVQYKYKSTSSDTTNVTDINSSIFSDWNRLINIDKDRKLVFNDEQTSYEIKYENYDSTNNIIKWNQIDIPINQGEDVVIRIRYKYSIGQPFINFYTPWSENLNMVFPAQFTETTEISTILADNETDTLNAKFSKTLINEGYQEHVNNKIIDNSQVFYHMPENIYSGFNTPENKLISLKDKLQNIVNDLDKYKALVDAENNTKYGVYLEWDNNTIKLSNHTNNNITINDNLGGVNDYFIRKNMNLIIRNEGTVPVNFYSIFSGNQEVPLLLDDEQFYDKYIMNYERVPLIIGESDDPTENIYYQTLGQWIYFRQNNPYSTKDIYYTTPNGRQNDILRLITGKSNVLPDGNTINDYLNTNKQGLLGYRQREYGNIKYTIWNSLVRNDDDGTYSTLYDYADNNLDYSDKDISFFYPISKDTIMNNNFLLVYEHIAGINTTASNQTEIYLNEKTSISNFINTYKPQVNSISMIKDQLNGAFLIPHIPTNTTLLCETNEYNQYTKLDVGKSLSIPVIFEYYLDGTSSKSITKTLNFDLRPSLIKDPDHFTFNITAKYDFSSINNELSNVDSTLIDSLT